MSLVSCLECKGTIGDTVNVCPHCGTDQANFKKTKMGIDSCLECKKEIGLNINICPHCGTNQANFKNTSTSIKNNSSTNNNMHPTGRESGKFNWMAFFFTHYYYAGYGKFGKAIFLSLLCFVPIVNIITWIRCGKNANAQLPIGRVKFSWGKVFLLILLQMIVFAPIAYMQEQKENKENQQQTLNQENTSTEQNNDIVTQAKEVIQEITDDSDEVKTVKNGKLNAYPNKTIGEAIDSFFGDSSWSSGVSEKGLKFVDVAGKITYLEKPINAKMQFELDKNGTQFSVRALEFNEIPQNQLMIEGLLEKIYEESNIKGNSTQENISDNSTNTTTDSNTQYVDYKENTSTQNLDNQENKKNLLYFDNVSFKGAINNNINLHMTLSIKNDGYSGREIIGSEYYDAYKKNIQIKGDIDDNNNFVFYEVDVNNPDKHTGTFSGTISNLNSISGSWISEDGSKEYPFYLTKL